MSPVSALPLSLLSLSLLPALASANCFRALYELSRSRSSFFFYPRGCAFSPRLFFFWPAFSLFLRFIYSRALGSLYFVPRPRAHARARLFRFLFKLAERAPLCLCSERIILRLCFWFLRAAAAVSAVFMRQRRAFGVGVYFCFLGVLAREGWGRVSFAAGRCWILRPGDSRGVWAWFFELWAFMIN